MTGAPFDCIEIAMCAILFLELWHLVDIKYDFDNKYQFLGGKKKNSRKSFLKGVKRSLVLEITE